MLLWGLSERRIIMDKLKNKNTIILIVSALLIVAAIVIAVVAISGNKQTEKKESQSETVSQTLDLAAIAAQNSVETTLAPTAVTGKYRVAASGDPLNLRLGPNVKTDIITYVPSGEEVEVLAVWEDWGYVIYEKSGGWLSMNYLEPVGASSSTAATTAQNEG